MTFIAHKVVAITPSHDGSPIMFLSMRSWDTAEEAEAWSKAQEEYPGKTNVHFTHTTVEEV